MREIPDPTTLIGKRVRAADGGNYGHLIVGFNANSRDFLVIPIVWSTGEPIRPGRVEPDYLDVFKASYRYMLHEAV